MQTSTSLKSDAFLTAALSAFTPLSVCVVLVTERKAHNIYLHIRPNSAQQLQVRSAGFEARSSLKLHR